MTNQPQRNNTVIKKSKMHVISEYFDFKKKRGLSEISPSHNIQSTQHIHYSIECIEDLPKKLSLIDVTMRMLSQDDPNYGGFKALFEDFHEEIRKAIVLYDTQHDNTAMIEEYVQRISELVMRRLHTTFWSRDRLHNPKDKIYNEKSKALKWVKPEHINLPEAKFTTNYAMWGVSSKLLKNMQKCRTPQSMQRCLDGAITAVCYAYSLSFPGREFEK